MNRLYIFGIVAYILTSMLLGAKEEILQPTKASLTMHAQDAIANHENNTEQLPHPKSVIMFFTQDDDDTQTPSGQYWPAQLVHYMHGKEKINTASAYIGQTSYSDIFEYPRLQEEMQTHYLGYFPHPQSNTTVYLYR